MQKVFFIVYASLIGLFSLNSCSSIDRDTSIDKNQNQMIEYAKAIFETTCVEQLSLDAVPVTPINILSLGEIVPDWPSLVATNSYTGSQRAFDISLQSTTYSYRALQGDDDQEVRLDQKMVVISDEENEASTCYILLYLPTNEYANLHKGKLTEETTNYSIPESFSGLKIWTHLDGSFARVNKYKDGNLVDYVSFFDNDGDGLLSGKIDKLFSLFGSIKIAKYGRVTKGGQTPENSEDMESWLLSMGWQCINGDWYDPYNNYVGDLEDAYNKFINKEYPDPFEKPEDPKDPPAEPPVTPPYDPKRPIYDEPQMPILGEDQPLSYQIDMNDVVYTGYNPVRSNSWDVAADIMNQLNCTLMAFSDTANIVVATERNDYETHYLDTKVNVRGVARHLINTLCSGTPVMVGVDYKKTNPRVFGNTIDSWVVLTGYNVVNDQIYFSYIDTNSSQYEWVYGSDHKFVYVPGTDSITGDHYIGDHILTDQPYHIVFIMRTR